MNLAYILITIFLILPINLLAYNENPCEGPSAMHGGLCVASKLNTATIKLEEAFNHALIRAKEENKSNSIVDFEALLLQSQAAWLKHRDIDCYFSAQSTGASGGWADVHESNCIVHKNNERTLFLNSLWAG